MGLKDIVKRVDVDRLRIGFEEIEQSVVVKEMMRSLLKTSST